MVKIFALILLLALNADARMCPGNIGGEYVVPACSTSFASCTTSSNQANSQIGVSYNWKASKFAASKTTTVCAIELALRKVGSPSFNIRVSVYGSTGTEPDESNIISQSSYSAANNLTTSYVYTSFTVSAAITSASEYWIVIQASAAGDGSNNVEAYMDTGCDYEEGVLGSSNGTSWSGSDNGRGFKYYLYE